MKDVFSLALSLSLLQATRHARRVYVGGLPPLANEQVIFLVLLLDSISSTNKGFNSIVDIWSRLKFDAFCVITLESRDVLCTYNAACCRLLHDQLPTGLQINHNFH